MIVYYVFFDVFFDDVMNRRIRIKINTYDKSQRLSVMHITLSAKIKGFMLMWNYFMKLWSIFLEIVTLFDIYIQPIRKPLLINIEYRSIDVHNTNGVHHNHNYRTDSVYLH